MAPESTFQDFLYEMKDSPSYFDRSRVLLDFLSASLAADAARLKAADDAYLATLTTEERKRLLTQRRIDALQRRLDNWWEDNMAWRFRPHPPDAEHDW